VIVVAVTIVARVFLRIPFALLRAQEKSLRYSVLNAAKGFVQIVLTLVFVIALDQGVLGVLLGTLGSEAAFCLVLVPGMLWGIRQWRFSRKTARDLLSFGFPLVPAGVAGFVLHLSDRYFLKLYSTLHDVGLYSLGYRLGEIIWEMVWAMQLAYPQFVLVNEKAPEARHLYARVITYYFGGLGFVVLILSVYAQEIVRVMAAPEYREAYRVVPLIALGQLLRGFVFIGPVGLTLKRKTTYHALMAVVAAGVNLCLNYLWIPAYGMMGAAAANAIAFGVQSLLITAVSQRYYPIPIEVSRLLKVAFAAAVVYLASTRFPADGELLLNVPAKAVLLALFPCLLAALRFFQPGEIDSAAAMLRVVGARLGFVQPESINK
jgi:O-antigen/teichoic acid export membrane protein